MLRMLKIGCRDEDGVHILAGIQFVVVAHSGDGVPAELLDIGDAFFASPIPKVGDGDELEVLFFAMFLKRRDQELSCDRRTRRCRLVRGRLRPRCWRNWTHSKRLRLRPMLHRPRARTPCDCYPRLPCRILRREMPLVKPWAWKARGGNVSE